MATRLSAVHMPTEWHREYCELYWQHNELQIIATCASLSEAKKIEARMNELTHLLGYIPAA